MWIATITFIGAAIGGIIGGLFTYMGVKMTINDNKQLHESENKKNALPLIKLELAEYDYKYKYVQFDFLYTEESKRRKRKNIVDTENISFWLKNVGQRELYDLHFANFSSGYFYTECDSFTIVPIVYRNDRIGINFCFYEKGNYDTDNLPNELTDTIGTSISFDIFFKDCYNNWYFQTVEVNIFLNLTPNTSINEKALNTSIRDFNILSAPIEVAVDELPWNK